MATGDLTATIGTASERDGANFDGVDDYVEIPHHASQLGANLSNGFTISAWINPKSLGEGGNGIIIDKSSSGASGTNGFLIWNTAVNLVALKINVGTSATSAGSSINLKKWQHILVTVSSGQLANWYIDGASSGTTNKDLVQAISTITATNVIRIGNPSTATTNTFDGCIKDVKMWKRVLTSAEIARDFAGTNVSEGQILWVPLKDDYNDIGPHALTGTNSGSILTNTLPNQILADVKQINLTTTSLSGSKIISVPQWGRDRRVKIIGVSRATA